MSTNNNGETFIINGDNINNIETFYNEINKVFINDNQSIKITNLDGLEDLFNEINNQDNPIQIVWKQFEKNRNDLGIDITIQWYEIKLQTNNYNKDLFNTKIQHLMNGNGETYFDIVLDIINDQNIILIKE